MIMGVRKIAVTKISIDALDLYNKFKAMTDSEHIASPVGIHALFAVLDENRPKNVLEIGGGIGTLSLQVLTYTDADLVVFEDHVGCIDSLKKNLSGFESRYTLIDDYEDFELPNEEYDLLIVDGGHRGLLRDVISRTTKVRGLFVEGGRAEQRKVIRQSLRNKYTFVPRHYFDPKKEFKGAHYMATKENSSAFIRHFLYWYWEFRIFKEIKRFLEYRFSLVMRKIKELSI